MDSRAFGRIMGNVLVGAFTLGIVIVVLALTWWTVQKLTGAC